MTWRDDHPGGIISCDSPGCARTRRNYCTPGERDQWVSFQEGNSVQDLCPLHRHGRRSEPRWLAEVERRAAERALRELLDDYDRAGWVINDVRKWLNERADRLAEDGPGGPDAGAPTRGHIDFPGASA